MALVSGIQGCSGKPVNEEDPAELFQDAEEDVKASQYDSAINKFRVLKNKFPYSKYSIEAKLRIADVYFLQEYFAEAAQSYEAFRDLHPKHEKVPYAMFRVGKSYYSDLPGEIARDLSSGYRAIDAFNEFLKRYPDAPEAEEARKSVAEIKRILAEKELYIARFYLRQDLFKSAKGRLEKILEMFPDTAPAKEARERLDQMNISSQGQEAASP